MMKIEAIFGGILVLFIVGVAMYTLATTSFGPRGGGAAPSGPAGLPTIQASANGASDSSEGVCGCYDGGFDLAGSNVGVMSSQYRTGFEQCRSVHGVEGGDAWTAGWNARLSQRPYEASCRSYRKRNA